MDTQKLPRGKCANCGKDIPVPSVRGGKGYFCSRVCASMKNYRKRYQGTMAGPMDKPDFSEKMGRKGD